MLAYIRAEVKTWAGSASIWMEGSVMARGKESVGKSACTHNTLTRAFGRRVSSELSSRQ